ncbi:MAG: LamG domain-containing protein [Dysgonamonadaceae bacterium]
MKNYYSLISAWITKKRLLFVFSMLVVTSMYAAGIDTTTGLVAHYSFESVSGSTVADASGKGNSAQLQGAATVTSGYQGQGGQFTAQADYMTLPDGIVKSLTNFTISSWVNLSAVNQWSRIFDFGTGQDYYMFLTPKASSGVIRFAIKNGEGEQVVEGKAPLTAGAWAHVAITFAWNEATLSGVIKLYVNGEQVGTNPAMTIAPSLLPSTTLNYIAKSQYSDPALDGTIDEFRIYNRTLSGSDIMSLAGKPEALINAYNSLNEAAILNGNANLENVISNLNLPTSLSAYPAVAIAWTSSKSALIGSDGVVTRPEAFDAAAKLTAVLSMESNGVTYTLNKEFTATVKSKTAVAERLVTFDFDSNNISLDNGTIKVTDKESGFVGEVKNDARIRTIGNANSEQFNVLDLGEGTGYFDMGTEIGKAIYSLSNYTMSGYFRIDENYTKLDDPGNFYWTFSNSDDADTDRNGYIIGSLKNQAVNVSSGYWNSGDQSVGLNENAAKGAWHHIAFVQEGNVAKIYIDGIEKKSNAAMTNLPSTALPREGFTGTLYNWLGRSNYTSDSYLKKTLLYDFRIFTVPLTQTDIALDVLEVMDNIDRLNNAYAENPDYIATELTTEKDNLNLGDLSAVRENLSLPTRGTLDPAINITWKSSNTNLIDASGIVTRPDFYNYTDTLTAVLVKNGQAVTKKFYATVVAKDGTPFTNNLLVKYDFSQVSGTTVTDVAEKQFRGELKEDASIAKMGTTTEYKVLSLGDSIGYFDMGEDVGKILYNLQDFTIGAYYRIDQDYDDSKLSTNGNFLWSFSNATDILSNASGYLIASLKNQAVTISPTNWNKEETVAYQKATKGSWHHLAYTQSGTTGTIYIDGMPVASETVTQLPANTLPKEGLLGTAYNWIGRSCYKGDLYLRQTLVYDFRVYDVALTGDEIQTSKLNVGNTITALDRAYEEGITSSIASAVASPYQLITGKGTLRITGLNGTEKIQVLDLSGRNVTTTNQETIALKSGLYIVKINNSIFKAYVK